MATLGGPDHVSRPLGRFGSEIQYKNREEMMIIGPLAYCLVQKSPKTSRVGRENAIFRDFSNIFRSPWTLEVWKHDPVPLMWPCRNFFILLTFALKRPLVAENGDLNLKYTHLLLAYLNRYQKSFTYEFANICKSYKSCVDKFFLRCPEVWLPKSEKAFHSSSSSIPWLAKCMGPRSRHCYV